MPGMTTSAPRKLAEAVRVIPADCHDNPTWKGLAYLALDLAMYAAVVAGLVLVDSPWLLVPLWILAGLTISALFIVGHDAAHGALFRSQRLAYLAGQFAMLPSLHLYEAWCFGHNRIHHGHTTRQEMDYVWHPLTPEQFRVLSPLSQLVHRVEWSCLGAGLYYMHRIWWDKMIWNFEPPEKIRGLLRRDQIVVGSYAALASAAVLALGAASYGSASGALWMWLKVLAVPFVVWNYSIGAAVYVHHICQDIPWHTRRDWNKFTGQVNGTTIIRLPTWLNVFYHHIFLHVAHHVDMRIPFYGLPAATEALQRAFPDDIVERTFGLGDYLETTKSCKLFDFERGVWLRYGESAAEPMRLAGEAS